jgi:hypothetical protein
MAYIELVIVLRKFHLNKLTPLFLKTMLSSKTRMCSDEANGRASGASALPSDAKYVEPL